MIYITYRRILTTILKISLFNGGNEAQQSNSKFDFQILEWEQQPTFLFSYYSLNACTFPTIMPPTNSNEATSQRVETQELVA